MRARAAVLWAFVCAGACAATAAEPLSIAAAANLAYVLKPLNAAFAAANPGVAITSQTGASGSLVAQIVNGAPFDVFLSADVEFPRKLIRAGGAEKTSLAIFAYGKLVLWTARESPGPFADVTQVIQEPGIHKVAIANPETAPYGRAALETLQKLNLLPAVRPKLVTGENIGMTAEYVSTGAADVGFVALSLLKSPSKPPAGRWFEVPPELYTPIAQAAVITNQGRDNASAKRYLAFLASAPARDCFRTFGYGLPPR